MDAGDMGQDLQKVLLTEEQIDARLTELAALIDRDYEGTDLLLVGVLNGAVMAMADLARKLHNRAQMDWMAVSSYGSGTRSSGVVRILKDLGTDIQDRHVLIVEDIIDSGLTLSWLVASMARVPLSDASCDLLASVFSPLDWQEALRLLRPGGGLLRMGPTRAHLMELRQKLYDEVRDYDDQKHLELIPPGMHLAHSETLSFPLLLADAQARADLLAMTPHGWRASAERRAAVIAEPFEVTVAIRYDWIEKNKD